MGLLLLLTSTLLSSYFHPWRVVDAQALFTIKGITLSIEPSDDVIRDTSVILKCQAVVSSSGQEPLSRHYTIYKDGEEVYTKTSSTSEDLLYRLPEARVSNTGKYKCQITIEDKKMISDFKRLTVTGLSVPEVHLNKAVISEGEEVTARCMAPGETGSIIFYFYEDSKEILEKKVNSNQTEVKHRFNSVGIHKVHCAYTVLVMPDSFKSKDSNTVPISVKEYPITLVLDISPTYKIYEGDRLDISCTIIKSQHSSQSIQLFLSQGTQLLRSESTKTKVSHNMTALAKNSGEFECRLVMGNVVKVATKTISVTELFSVPILTMSPAEVFEKEYMKLTCKSESFASEKLRREELIYSLDPSKNALSQNNGEFSGLALQHDLNYTCIARAKGIVKHSNTLTVRPKVPVSNPKISVVDKVVLKQPFKILCKSDNGSLPINYTLLKDKSQLSTISVKLPIQKALFTVTVTHTDEISKYTCEAKNSHKKSLVSEKLNATVIVPVSRPTLTVIPPLPEISEGDHLYLICGTQGTPPVTFKWYRVGNKQPLFTTTSNNNHTNYQVSGLTKQHSGTYYCEAVNHANNAVSSELVDIEVNLATWKKALIGGFCLLVVSVLVVVLVLCFRSKRVRVDKAVTSVWSERPPEEAANDEETSMVSNEPDVEYTEVVHPRAADSAKVPLRKGTDTVYSELQNAPHGAADHHDYGSVEYAELNGEQPEINHCSPEVNNYQDLPVPVD
ncbi:platelet endothelial cell adhesion molecule isoform X3 [Thunnus maccoyii]|uniref:platelet endothelial cell adhesion molecule isoform X3 n=1 Tax=Thunnus maccoyii TaxID=8240 RepID=UPI001C4B5B80|nr:platelet endothelial cell adhesion molecule isoform X3 [Thunnus maccoyii]